MRIFVRRRRFAGLTVALAAAVGLGACSSSGSAGGGGQSGSVAAPGSMSAGGSLSADAAKFYKGKTITITTKSSPGGNGYATAQLLSQYLPKFIPGSPKVEVKVNAGGSGSVMMKNVEQVYPADGTQLALPDAAVVLRWMFKQAGADYALDKMKMVGDLSAPLITVVRSAAGKDIDALIKRTDPLRAGNTAPGGTGVIDLTLGMKLLGVPVKEIYGYEGAGPEALAIERGELDTASPAAGSFLSGFKSVVDSKKAYALYQIGVPSSGGTARSTAFPDIPTLQELYKTAYGKAPSGPAWDAVLKLADIQELGIFLMARDSTPPAALEALNAGWTKMSQDSDFVAAVKKQLGGADIINPSKGAELVNSLISTKGALLTTIQNAAQGK